MKRFLREPEILQRMAMGKTKFDDDYIKTGRAKWVYLGERTKGLPEEEVDALIDEIAAAPRKPMPMPARLRRKPVEKRRRRA